ncbi:MAG: ATP-binding protein [Alphaproteobacteria bacterium]|nr:ATP-binding protein [Alphaproteobacteria bacterium]
MTLPPADQAPVQGLPDCPHCRGDGYVVRGVGALAVAERCSCVPVCPRCHGTGRVTVERDGRPLTGRCRCQLLPDRIVHFNHAQVPARHRDATLATFARGAMRWEEPTKLPAYQAAADWFASLREGTGVPPGIVFHGPVGRGKTHLLIGMIRAMTLDYGLVARFVEFSRLLGQLKERYSRGQGDSELLGELAEVPVLAVDELGKGRLTDWELAIIDEVVSRRYNAGLCTFGTTNYLPKEASGIQSVNLANPEGPRQTLGDRVGDRVYSRLREMCSFVEVEGGDMRGKVTDAAG